ncbi:uncharacterized protein LOC142634861 [Castanea sativa]|uniref:uncharacterized protein LOC142634861 n=1 Tax=Castanea sativa TaxID=21020 RepID=UPI003F651754
MNGTDASCTYDSDRGSNHGPRHIHVLVKVRLSNFEFICTVMYASPRFHERCILWNNLKNVSNLHDKPWIIAGDFNEVLAEGDKFGGRCISFNRSLIFEECIDHSNMIDMGFVGPHFTWTNRRNITDLVQERIDRFFANPSWYASHPNARVTHLTRYLSFLGIFMEAWSRTRSLRESIENFSRKASDWNKHHFGNIFGRKKRVMARLNGIQKAIASHPSHSLNEMEKTLHEELNTLLEQEEEFWVQKSCINRLIEGDRNTAFHHMSTIVRRRRNKISCIKNYIGEWIQSEVRTMNFIRGGFEKLFTTSLEFAPLTPPQPSRWQAALSNEEKENLSVVVTDAEIKDGLWALKAFKAPGLMAFMRGFFKDFALLWEIW